jgi:hypothetical protein
MKGWFIKHNLNVRYQQYQSLPMEMTASKRNSADILRIHFNIVLSSTGVPNGSLQINSDIFLFFFLPKLLSLLTITFSI